MLCYVLLAWMSYVVGDLSRPADLSHYYDNNTIYINGGTPFQFIKTHREPKGNGVSSRWISYDFETAEHGGTHMDAPYHFNKNAVYLNLRDKATENRDYAVTPEDFELWESQNGAMPSGVIVVLDFGWAEKYLGTYISSYHFPGLSMSGALWLVRTGKVFGVGTDAVPIANGYDLGYPAHTVLTANNLYILEHVAFPEVPLDPFGYNILALPMKIRNGTGAPCRVLAVP